MIINFPEIPQLETGLKTRIYGETISHCSIFYRSKYGQRSLVKSMLRNIFRSVRQNVNILSFCVSYRKQDK